MEQKTFDPTERGLTPQEWTKPDGEKDHAASGILMLASLWLGFLIYPLVGLLQGIVWALPLALALASTLVFFSLYFWVIWGIAFRTLRRIPWPSLLVMGLLGLALPLVWGKNWLGFFVYTGLITGFTLRLKQMMIAVIVMEGLTILTTTIAHAPWWETVALTTVTLLGSGMAFGINWLRALNQQLHVAHRRIAAIAASEERLRLARELHDSVKQQIFVTSMEIGAARALLDQDRQSADTHLHEAETVIRQVHQDLQALVQELRPTPEEEKDLAQAIQTYTAPWSQRTRIAVIVHLSGKRRMSPMRAQALFRVVQEALTNIEKHSTATQAEITLTWSKQHLQMQIRDNGHGFLLEQGDGRGYGLLHIRERMAALGGELQIASQPGCGVTITCLCPLPVERRQKDA